MGRRLVQDAAAALVQTAGPGLCPWAGRRLVAEAAGRLGEEQSLVYCVYVFARVCVERDGGCNVSKLSTSCSPGGSRGGECGCSDFQLNVCACNVCASNAAYSGGSEKWTEGKSAREEKKERNASGALHPHNLCLRLCCPLSSAAAMLMETIMCVCVCVCVRRWSSR